MEIINRQRVSAAGGPARRDVGHLETIDYTDVRFAEIEDGFESCDRWHHDMVGKASREEESGKQVASR
jgi:hypothetical protein